MRLLSAGRADMSEETQALCFPAGANSIFCGDKLLTTLNPAAHGERTLFDKLGIKPMGPKPIGHQPMEPKPMGHQPMGHQQIGHRVEAAGTD